jgi:DNA-binding FadR family transcriptional regulator
MFRSSNTLRRNVHSQVTDRVGGSIVRGEIGIGETLPPEMQICDMMNVSRTVVREAIRTLTGKGLVESRPKSGTRVRPPEQWNQLDPDVLRWHLETTETERYLEKLFELRTAVEPTVAAIAATQAREADIARIRAGCDGMDTAKTDEDFIVADITFHQSVYFATRNEFFWPIAQMFEVTLRKSFTIVAPGEHRPRALAEHRAVLDAIASGDPEAARETTVVLLKHSADDLVRILGREFEQPARRPARK